VVVAITESIYITMLTASHERKFEELHDVQSPWIRQQEACKAFCCRFQGIII
jgi:hydroxymethylpyrimidine/phosphomethylpyrimidine kinase